MPQPGTPRGITPEFSATAVIDLKGLLGSIKQAKGQGQSLPVIDDQVNLLDVFAAEAESLRESKAEPDKIMPILLDKVGWPPGTPLWNAAVRAGEMAAEDEDNPTYHNSHHVTEVILAAYVLGMREHLPIDRVVELMVAAAAHDLGHTGGINSYPYELETKSYQIVHPVLVESGLEEERIERIGRMIVSTDFMNGVPQVREAYEHFKTQPPEDEERMLSAQCVILTEADVLFSCFNENYNDRLSKLLSVEWKRQDENLSFKERTGFLSSVRFVSDAAVQLGLEERRKSLVDSLNRKTGKIDIPPPPTSRPDAGIS